ncbi:MAG: hypothetical protein Kow0070_21520 [Anaerolineales bacterium]
MNRKQWIIAGIVLVLFAFGLLLLPRAGSSVAPTPTPAAPPAKLVYCSDEQVKPCVVSFGVDVRDNMLINLLLPDLSFPAFSLVISRAGVEASYVCQRVSYALNTAYCAGPKQPPGEPLTLRLIASKDKTLLAEGNLSIIGLAFPTLGVAYFTPPQQETPAPAETEISPSAQVFSTVPPSPSVLPTRTKPLPTFYPGPSYPGPSYP